MCMCEREIGRHVSVCVRIHTHISSLHYAFPYSFFILLCSALSSLSSTWVQPMVDNEKVGGES